MTSLIQHRHSPWDIWQGLLLWQPEPVLVRKRLHYKTTKMVTWRTRWEGDPWRIEPGEFDELAALTADETHDPYEGIRTRTELVPVMFSVHRRCQGCEVVIEEEVRAGADGRPARNGSPQLFHSVECKNGYYSAARSLGATVKGLLDRQEWTTADLAVTDALEGRTALRELADRYRLNPHQEDPTMLLIIEAIDRRFTDAEDRIAELELGAMVGSARQTASDAQIAAHEERIASLEAELASLRGGR
jgi:hypothetical protein